MYSTLLTLSRPGRLQTAVVVWASGQAFALSSCPCSSLHRVLRLQPLEISYCSYDSNGCLSSLPYRATQAIAGALMLKIPPWAHFIAITR